MTKESIVVIGAGVIGLQTAVTLLQNGYNVSIVAKHWPHTSMSDGRYTSAWAGAQWRTHAASDSEASGWDGETWRYWQALLKDKTKEEIEKIGLYPISLTEYCAIAPEQETPWWSSLSPLFKHIPREDLPPGIATGVSLPSFVANPDVYLPWLVKQAKDLGAKTHEYSIPVENGLESALLKAREICKDDFPQKSSAFVLALGLFANDLLRDDTVSPVRGQTLLVKGEALELKTKIGSKPGDVLAVIPRVGTGTTILGATRGPGRWDLAPDPKETKWLLQEGKLIAPELFHNGEAQVIKINVGLRPHRDEGARVAIERIGEHTVIYSYGHDGSGYQNSVGSANKVVRLLKERL